MTVKLTTLPIVSFVRLIEENSDELSSTIKKLIDQYMMDLYEHPKSIVDNYSTPTFKVVDNAAARWTGVCDVSVVKDRYDNYIKSNILIQKGICGDENSLKRTIAHEVVHHIVYSEIYARRKKITKADAHGPEFSSWAAILNNKYGADFVTETSDEADVFEAKPYYLGVVKDDDGLYWWTWFVKPTPAIIQTFTVYEKQGKQVYIVKSTNRQAVAPWAKFPKLSSASHPESAKVISQEILLPNIWNAIKSGEVKTTAKRDS